MSILQFKKANCKNCYKCVRNCAVKAIEVSNHQAKIIEKDCILCGTCSIVCPQNAKEVRNDLNLVKEVLSEGKPVLCSLAPSFRAYYPDATITVMEKALKLLGFTGVSETAQGAVSVKTEYERLVKDNPDGIVISSSCPTINTYIRKYKPDLLRYLAPVLTPMQAHAKQLKCEFPDSKVVFIGPCISKKGECEETESYTDIALTFEELNEWFAHESIDLSDMIKCEKDNDKSKYLSRFFPISGGILKTMDQKEGIQYLSMDGIEHCIDALHEIENGHLHGCFIEMSACVGSCIGGPSFRKREASMLSSIAQVTSYAKQESGEVKDFTYMSTVLIDKQYIAEPVAKAMPSEAKILSILKKMGKSSKEDELNCGMCGYASCREKAIAVYFNKAETSMCLPFMKERAESFSDQIINVTPNAILTVDLDLHVLQMNDSAKKLFHIVEAGDIIGAPVSRILDEFDFVNMIVNETKTYKKRSFLTEYNVYLDQMFFYDKANSIIICIMKDITAEKKQKNQVMKARLRASDMADDIMEKQLRIVHEIASLLGETAADTKVAVSKLKDTIMMDEESEE